MTDVEVVWWKTVWVLFFINLSTVLFVKCLWIRH
jgi:hypothetical protein